MGGAPFWSTADRARWPGKGGGALEVNEVRCRLGEKQGRGLGAGGDEVQGVIHKSVIIWANGGRG